ncbi:MAG: tetratricopeptide repeat protein [Nitrospiria bacterium]
MQANIISFRFAPGTILFLFMTSLLFYFISPVLSQEQSQEKLNAALDHLQKGTQFLFSGNLDSAEKEFLQAISQNPALHRAHFGLGLVYLQKNQPDQAEKFFRTTLSLQPDYAPAYRGMGQVFETKGDLFNAVVNYQRAILLEKANKAFANDAAIARFRLSQIGETPEIALNVREHYQKATSLLKDKKNEEALKEFALVLELAPENLDALENAGVILFDQGKLDQSSGLLQRILRIDPNILFAHYLLGVINESQGKTGDAWEEFHTLLRIGEKTPRQKDVMKAREKIEQLGPTREAAIQIDNKLKKAGQLYEKEELEASEKEYLEVLRIVPANIKAKFGMALIDFKKEKFAAAKKLFLEVIDKEPQLVRARFFLGETYLKEKEIQKAFDELSKVIEFGKDPAVQKEFKTEIEEAGRDLAQMGGNVTRGLQIQRLLDEGNELINKEDFDRAKEKFIQALAMTPENLEALEKLGSIYLRETSFDPGKAQAIFEKMLQVNSELLLPRLYLAFLYDQKGEVEKSFELYREVIRLDKKGTEVGARAKKFLSQLGDTPEKAKQVHLHLKKGGELARENKLPEAKKEYQKVLEIVPNQVQALFLIALIDLNQKNLEEAEKLLRVLISVDPDHLDGHLQLGLLLGGRGAYEEGVAELEKVLSLGKEGKSVQTAKNKLTEMKKKADGEKHFKAGIEALKKLDDLEKTAPSKPGEPVSGDKNSLLNNGIKELEEAIKLNQDNPYYFYNLGYAYVRKFDLVSAEFLFKKAIEKKPDLLIAHYRLAVMYDLAGAPEASLKEYEQVISLGKPEDEEVKEANAKLRELKNKITAGEEAKGYSIVGEALFLEQKNKEKALPLLKKAAELAPGNEDYWYDLGILYEAIPDEDEAAKAFQQAINVRSNFSKPYFYLGVIQEKKGRIKEAYENFKQAKKYLVDQKSPEAVLIQSRIDFYEKKVTETLSVSLFNFDSNIGFSADAPQSDIYSVYSLDLRFFHYKSLNFLLSSDFSTSNLYYYYLQTAYNSDTYSLEGQWIDLDGFQVALGSSGTVNFFYGGSSGWSTQMKIDLVKSAGWFDTLKTHLDYTYSVSTVDSFFDSIGENLSWSLLKSNLMKGFLTLGLGLSNSDVVAQDDSSVAWNVSAGYTHAVIPYLLGSFNAGVGQVFFKNPDSSALRNGLGPIYRKNLNLNVSTSLNYTLYKNVSISGTAGWQMVSSNLGGQISLDTTDLLSKQAAPIGAYQKYTAGVTISYLF